MSSPVEPVQHAIVVGGGIGGLMSALALSHRGIAVTVLERDPAPPPIEDYADSLHWRRAGVPQALFPHFFMGRLYELLQARYPALLVAFRAAGAEESGLTDYLHPLALKRYRPQPGDARLRSICCRRTTFEMVVRKYVAGQLHGAPVTIVSDADVRDLVFADAGDAPGSDHAGTPRVGGVEVLVNGEPQVIRADAVVDASGRAGKLWNVLGDRQQVEQRDSGIWYFTRHYRLREGASFPKSAGVPGATFPDFIVGALQADNRTFTTTFQIYRDDKAVARALRDPAHFQAMCMKVARIRPWVDPAVAEPTSEVFGFAQMDSYWRRLVIDGEPRVLGYYPVGDSAIRGNPKFGRGCTWASLSAHMLADELARSGTHAAHLVAYEAALVATFAADWETMRAVDQSTEAAFAISTGRRMGTLGERVAMRLEVLVNRASLLEPAFFRELWGAYHGFQGMRAWLGKPAAILALVRSALRWPLHARALAPLDGRPTRQEMLGDAAAAQ